MPLGVEVDLDPGHIVLDGDPAPPTYRGTAASLLSKFRDAGIYTCVRINRSQTARWITMSFHMEVGLGPGHIVLWGPDPALPRKEAQQPPLFGSRLLWPNGRPSQLLLSSCSFCRYHTHA